MNIIHNLSIFNILAGYNYNEDPFSIKEPGIGLLILISFIQFAVGNIFLYLLENRPWVGLMNKSQKRKGAVDNEKAVEMVKILNNQYFLVNGLIHTIKYKFSFKQYNLLKILRGG